MGSSLSSSALFRPTEPSYGFELPNLIYIPELFGIHVENVWNNTEYELFNKKENIRGLKIDKFPCLFFYLSNGNKSKHTIMYFHSNSCDLGQTYEELLMLHNHLKANILAIEYEGFGLSYYKGTPNQYNINRRALAAFNFLMSLNLKSKNILLFGRSIGTGVASKLASNLKLMGIEVGGVILHAPFISIQELVNDHASYASYLIDNIYDNYSNLRRLGNNEDSDIPILIIHGREDEIIPVNHSEYLIKYLKNKFKNVSYPNDSYHNMYYVIDDLGIPIKTFLKLASKSRFEKAVEIILPKKYLNQDNEEAMYGNVTVIETKKRNVSKKLKSNVLVNQQKCYYVDNLKSGRQHPGRNSIINEDMSYNKDTICNIKKRNNIKYRDSSLNNRTDYQNNYRYSSYNNNNNINHILSNGKSSNNNNNNNTINKMYNSKNRRYSANVDNRKDNNKKYDINTSNKYFDHNKSKKEKLKNIFVDKNKQYFKNDEKKKMHIHEYKNKTKSFDFIYSKIKNTSNSNLKNKKKEKKNINSFENKEKNIVTKNGKYFNIQKHDHESKQKDKYKKDERMKYREDKNRKYKHNENNEKLKEKIKEEKHKQKEIEREERRRQREIEREERHRQREIEREERRKQKEKEREEQRLLRQIEKEERIRAKKLEKKAWFKQNQVENLLEDYDPTPKPVINDPYRQFSIDQIVIEIVNQDEMVNNDETVDNNEVSITQPIINNNEQELKDKNSTQINECNENNNITPVNSNENINITPVNNNENNIQPNKNYSCISGKIYNKSSNEYELKVNQISQLNDFNMEGCEKTKDEYKINTKEQEWNIHNEQNNLDINQNNPSPVTYYKIKDFDYYINNNIINKDKIKDFIDKVMEESKAH